jgi:uncharacterized phage-like protein YoqJ
VSDTTKTADTLKAKTCCAAGHHNIPDCDIEYVNEQLRREIGKAIEDGYQCFLTNFEDGVCQLFARAVVEKQHENDTIRLEAVLPYHSRHDELMGDEACKPLLLSCADITFSGEKPTARSAIENRREQLRRSSRMILVYDGREGGSTFEAIRMGHDQRTHIREIPLGL